MYKFIQLMKSDNNNNDNNNDNNNNNNNSLFQTFVYIHNKT